MWFVNMLKKFKKSKAFNLSLITVALIILFQILNHNFLNPENISGIMIACSLAGTITVGMACLMMSGGVDLSAGANACFCSMIFALLLRANVVWPIALIITLICGAAGGLVNAFLCNVLEFVPFIATIGMQSVFKAAALLIVNGQTIAIPESAGQFVEICTGKIWVFPIPFVVMVILMFGYGILIGRTKFGRQMLLCGGNRRAARLAGLNSKKISTIMFANCGAVAALAGATVAARMRNASPYSITGAEMDGMTAAILGGVSFFGGGSSGMGVVLIGLILLQVFQNGLVTVGLNAYWQVVAKGGLLIIALIVDFYREKKRIAMLKATAKVAKA